MECIGYEIRLRPLKNGYYNAVAAVRTHGRTGTSLTEIRSECYSGPCSNAERARRCAEERTQAYLANQYACLQPLPLAAVQWVPRACVYSLAAPRVFQAAIGVASAMRGDSGSDAGVASAR